VPYAEAELAFQRSLRRLSVGPTVVVVTHRLRPIRTSIESWWSSRAGSSSTAAHDDLMAADGVYARVYRLQYVDDGVGSSW